MAEALPSTTPPTRDLHVKNVTMLLEKLKELRMDTEIGCDDSRIYARVESKFLQFFNEKTNIKICLNN